MAVDERAVGTTDIEHLVLAVDLAQLGVAARDFGVMKSEGVGRLPPDPVELLVQVKLLALIGAMNDDEPRHETSPRWCYRMSNDTELMSPPYPRLSQRSRDLESRGEAISNRHVTLALSIRLSGRTKA